MFIIEFKMANGGENMEKRKVISYASLLLAEVVALFCDTQLHKLQMRAARTFSTPLLIIFTLIPLLLIGILLAFGLCTINHSKSIGLFIGFTVFNIVALLMYIFLGVKAPLKFFDLRGTMIMLGVSIGGIVYLLMNTPDKE